MNRQQKTGGGFLWPPPNSDKSVAYSPRQSLNFIELELLFESGWLILILKKKSLALNQKFLWRVTVHWRCPSSYKKWARKLITKELRSHLAPCISHSILVWHRTNATKCFQILMEFCLNFITLIIITILCLFVRVSVPSSTSSHVKINFIGFFYSFGLIKACLSALCRSHYMPSSIVKI